MKNVVLVMTAVNETGVKETRNYTVLKTDLEGILKEQHGNISVEAFLSQHTTEDTARIIDLLDEKGKSYDAVTVVDPFSEVEGKVVDYVSMQEGNQELIFHFKDGTSYSVTHELGAHDDEPDHLDFSKLS